MSPAAKKNWQQGTGETWERSARVLRHAVFVGLSVCYLVFFAVLYSVTPQPGDVPPDALQDLFLVGANFLPMALVAFIMASVGLHFGMKCLHVAMTVTLTAFLLGVGALWGISAEHASEIDRIFAVALLLPGVAMLLSQWSYMAWRLPKMEAGL